jgi:protein-S-isoprenylcysteine O-methyltransferase Ste14
MLKSLSLCAYVSMMAAFLGLIFTRSLFSTAPLVIALQTAAVLLFLWARITFGRRSYHVGANPTEGGLVTGGPYCYIRHPIYTALCLFIFTGIAAHWSWWTALCGVLVLGSALVRIYCEERLVAARYPEYRQYAARTWRMIPYIF